MDRAFEKFYRNYEQPPFAPTYYPTEEDFKDPIKYIAKIKPEAERYGVVKIKPPTTFRPPFAIDGPNFNFTPRVQKLNQIEVLVRARLIFDVEIHNFWHLKGRPLHVTIIDGKQIDLFKLFKLVKEGGGEVAVSEQRRWNKVAKQMGFKYINAGSKVKETYTNWVAPFVKALPEVYKRDDDVEGTSGECQKTMQGRRRVVEPRTKSMSGVSRPIKRQKTRSSDPMDEVMCTKCGRGDDETRLLLCEDCEYALHTHCCVPPLVNVPKGEWRCDTCVIAAEREIANSFGFHDSQTSYNLCSFWKYADNWKRAYFQQNPLEVPREAVEKEFWKKVIDLDESVRVKYGADLLASTMGSGFPMPGKGFSERSDAARWNAYANHPWNLNNMPVLKESVLSHIDIGISGMIVPWVYVGMCFSAFCWHTEDHWTYSVNFMHKGERKIWYGVSGSNGEQFDTVVKALVPEVFEMQPDILHHMTTMINPMLLINKGVKVYTVHQEPGDFVITFPRAYHAGYNEGFNVAEAVNFAPVDWLRKGWQCISDYALVRRNCVFSYEELLMHMVAKAETLSIAMCVATREQLQHICKREDTLRTALLHMGVVKMAQKDYEEVPDDLRCCLVCRTTLFMAGVQCAHGRLVCLEHVTRVCSICTPNHFTLQYRYTMQELCDLCEGLMTSTQPFDDWKDDITGLLMEEHDDGKPTLDELRSRIDMAKELNFPRCAPLDRALSVVKRCEQVALTANKLLTRRVRTRSNGRLSSADLKEVQAIGELRRSLNSLPCQIPHITKALNDFAQQSDVWRSEAVDLLREEEEDMPTVSNDVSVVDRIHLIIDRADDLDLNFPEINDLKKMLDRRIWLLRAEKVLNWKSNSTEDESQMEDAHSSAERWSSDQMNVLIREGSSLASESARVKNVVTALKTMFQTGHVHENQAEAMRYDGPNTGIESAESAWSSLVASDWMSAHNLNLVRAEVFKARRIHKHCKETKEGECTLGSVTEAEKECKESLFMKQTSEHDDLFNLLMPLEQFCSQLSQLFLRSPSYYSLLEVLMGRSDVSALIRGSPMPLNIMAPQSVQHNWKPLEEYESSDQLKAQVNRTFEEQSVLLKLLRECNASRSIKETCYCNSEAEGETIKCHLCQATFHGSCAVWNSDEKLLLCNLYLCARCSRGKRPEVEQVREALVNAPASLESTLVTVLVENGSAKYESAIHIVDQYQQHPTPFLAHALEESVLSVLCIEVTDESAWTRIWQVFTSIRNVSEQEQSVYAWMREQNSVNNNNPPLDTLFEPLEGGTSKSRRRSNGPNKSPRKYRKRTKRTNNNEVEEEGCSANNCIKPNGERLGWVQCETGCSGWYHCVCVGLSETEAERLPVYTCYKCTPTAPRQSI